jgi:hypothetical protein
VVGRRWLCPGRGGRELHGVPGLHLVGTAWTAWTVHLVLLRLDLCLACAAN